MKILLAIDGSAAAQYAAEFFCRLPHQESLEIEVLSVINTPDVHMSTSSRAWLDEYLNNLNAAADEAFAKVQRCFEGSAAKLLHFKASGHVGQRIVDRAGEIGAQLIILGARGHSTVSRLLLGSVSDYVGRHAACAVLTVRPPEDETPPPETLRVTLCYDGSTPSQQILEHLSEFSWRGHVDIELLSIVQIFPEFPAEGIDLMREQIEQECAQTQQRTEEVAKQLSSEQHLRVHARVLAAEHVGEGILHAANDFQSQLILIGNTGRSLIPRLLLGSVSSYVLRHAKQSVWVVR